MSQRIQFSQHGGPEVLQQVDAPVVEPAAESPAPGRYTPEDIEILLKADQLLKAGRSVGTGAR